jgi:Ca2+-binding RTX toxin-like protein
MSLVRAFSAYDESDPFIPLGVFVAAGHVNSDDNADIIVGPFTGGSWVKVFSGAAVAAGQDTVIRRFQAFTPENVESTATDISGGVTVAAGYVNADGYADIVAGTDLDGSHVKVFSGIDPSENGVLLDTHAFATGSGPTFQDINGGIAVAAGDFDADGRADVVASTLFVGPHVKVLSGDDGSPLPLTFPLLGSIVTRCGDSDQTGYNGDVVVAGESNNDTIFGGAGDDVAIGDNGIALRFQVVIPIDTVALLSTGRAFPGGGLFNGDALTPQRILAPFVVPRVGMVGSLTQTGIRGNVWLNGAGADNVIDGDVGDDTLIGNNGVVVQLSVLAQREDPYESMSSNSLVVPGAPSDMVPSNSVAPQTGLILPPEVLLALVGIAGTVSQVGVTGNVTVIGAAGQDSITAGAGNDFVAGDNAVVVHLTVGSEVNNGDDDDSMPSSGGPGVVAHRLVEIGVAGIVSQLGVEGNVSLSGGAAPDTLLASTGNDTVIGDNAIDVVNEATARVVPPPTTPISTPSGPFVAETVIGVAGIVVQYGVFGGVTLQGGAASNPVIDGDTGNDLLVGNNAVVVSDIEVLAAFNSASPYTLVVGGATIDSLVSVLGSVRQTGVKGSALLTSPATGDDTLTGNTGNDTLIGDNVIYVSLLEAALAAGNGQAGGGPTSNSAIVTGAGDDRMGSDGIAPAFIGPLAIQIGIDADATLSTGAGQDTLNTQGGDVTLVGDNAAVVRVRVAPTADDSPVSPQTLGGASGLSFQYGVVGSVALTAGAGNDTLTAANGDPILIGDDAFLAQVSGVTASTPADSTGSASFLQRGVLQNVSLTQTGPAGQDRVSSAQGDALLIGDSGAVVSPLVTGEANAGIDAGTGTAEFGQLGVGGVLALTGGAADDTITAAVGDDTLIGDNGIDVSLISGPGPGNTALPGGVTEVSQNGIGTNVTLVGDAAANSLTGAAGNDLLIGNNGILVSLSLTQSAGPCDPQQGVGGYVSLQGGGGNDTLNASAGNVQVLVGDNAVIVDVHLQGAGDCPRQDDDDALTGVVGDVTVNGLGGDDRLIGSNASHPSAENLQIGDNGYVQMVKNDHPMSNSPALTGAGGDVMVEGGAGNDTLLGAAGGNTQDGDNATSGASQDAIAAGQFRVFAAVGDDLIVGGAGNDTVYGDNSNNDLSSPIEVPLGVTATGGDGNDTILGNGGDDTLLGQEGNDSIDGGAGNDILVGGPDNDTLIGGIGDDSYIFGDDWGHDTVVEQSGGGDDTLSFPNVTANLTFAINGSAGLSVTDGSNTVTAAGDNVETLLGGMGNDVFVFADQVKLAGGSGVIDGVGGFNTLDYSAYKTAVTVNLATDTATGTQTVTDIQTVLGGSGNDTLTGDGNDNLLVGNDGDDSLSGAAGNDTLAGGRNNDILIGGADNDTYVFGDGWGNDTITEAAGGGNDTITFGTFTVGTLTFPAETDALLFTIQVNGNGLEAFEGTSTIAAAGDNIENLVGGSGDDTFAFGNGLGLAGGAGTIDGGGGANTLDYSLYTTAVHLDLVTGGGTATGTTLVRNITEAFGGSGNDLLTGHGSADYYFVGLSGNDSLSGGSGNDTLDGGAGNDALDGGSGNDLFIVAPNGGTQSGGPSRTVISDAGGNDTLDLSGSPVGVTLNLDLMATDQVVDASGDVLRINGQVENLIGSAFNDAITAGSLTVPRTLDGRGHTTVPPGNALAFDAHGHSVTFTATTITATGLAAVTYLNFDNFNFVNQGALAVNSVATISGTQGIATDPATLATFIDQGGLKPQSEYGAVIDWNDGTAPTPGALTISGGLLVVSGSHLYAAGGTYHPQVTLSDFSRSVTATTTANITSRSTDVTSRLDIQRSGAYYNRRDQLFYGSLTLTNMSNSSIAGSLVIRLVGLTAGVRLQYAAVTLGGQTYQLPVDNNDVTNPSITLSQSLLVALAPGQSVAISLRFSDPAFALIDFDIKVFSDTSIP